MKRIVAFRVYGIPLLLAILLMIRLNLDMTPFRIFGKSLFLFAAVALALLTDKRYIQHFAVDANTLTITYINQFLQTKTDVFELKDLTNMRLDKRRDIAPIWPPYLELTVAEERKDYLIVQKTLYEEVQSKLTVFTVPGEAS